MCWPKGPEMYCKVRVEVRVDRWEAETSDDKMHLADPLPQGRQDISLSRTIALPTVYKR